MIEIAYGCEKHYTEWYGWLTGVRNTVRNGTDGLRVYTGLYTGVHGTIRDYTGVYGCVRDYTDGLRV